MHNLALVPLLYVALLGLATTSSSLLGVTIGLYCPLSKRVLACVLAFAAGTLISALAIELAFQSVQELHHLGFSTGAAWAFAGGGFALGATIYYWVSLFLESKGAAVRYPTRFREYAREQMRRDSRELIGLLSRCDLLRHLPPEEIEDLLPYVRSRRLAAGDTLFRAGDPGDALYIVARGGVEILAASGAVPHETPRIAELGEGSAFGEMALLSGGPRTATVRAAGETETELLAIEKRDFDHLMATDPQLAEAVERLSHERAITNLGAGGPHAVTWAKVATASLDHLSRNEANRMLKETGSGAGLAIVFGNILDTIPGCLVIGAKFTSIEEVSLTLALGMFIGGIPEAAASAAILRRGI